MQPHCPWQVLFLQLPQEVHPLLCFLGEGAEHLRSWDRIVPRKRKDSTVLTGESHRVIAVSVDVFFLKSTNISTVLRALSIEL